MAEKEAGQAAYEKSLGKKSPGSPKWRDLPKIVRRGWATAAGAPKRKVLAEKAKAASAAKGQADG